MRVKQKKGSTGRVIMRSSRKLIGAWALISACGCLGVAYIVTINDQTTVGFRIREQEQQRVAVAQEVQNLESELSALTSIGVIKNAARSMDFVEGDDAQYAAPDTGVAVGTTAARP